MSTPYAPDYLEIANCPEVVQLCRNGKVFEAKRAKVGELPVRGAIAIGDAGLFEGDDAEGAPVLEQDFPAGTHPVYAYRWTHGAQTFDACVVVSFATERAFGFQQLTIHNEARPDLREGVIVDTGELVVSTDELGFKFSSGEGDGYFPVFLATTHTGLPQSLIIDFKLWKVPRMILRKSDRLDEYGFVVSDD